MSPKLVFLIGLPAVVIGLVLGVLLSDSLGSPDTQEAPPAALSAGPSPTPAADNSGSGENLTLDPRGVSVVPANAPRSTASRRNVELTASRVAQASSSVVAPEILAAEGDGIFTGEVLEADGAPLAGVWIDAVAISSGSFDDPTKVGSAPPPVRSLNQALQEAAEDWAEELSRRVHGQTDAAGRFALTGLDPTRRYRVRAYREGWTFTQDVSRGSLLPGAELRFFGRQVVEVTVDLVTADGSSPSEGAVEVEFADSNEDYGWSADAPTLRLPVGRSRVRGHAGVFEHERLRGNASGGLRSDWTELNLDPGGQSAVRLLLESRDGFHGRLRDPEEWGSMHSFRAVAYELTGGASLDEEQLKNKAEHTSNVRYDGYSLLGLTPGRYALGIINRSSELFASGEVELTGGLVQHDFEIVAPNAENFLELRASDPEGRPLLDLDLDLRREREEGRSNNYGLNTRIQPDGALALFGASRFYEDWNQGDRWFLVAEHNLLGESRIELSEGQRQVKWVFQPPGSIDVRIAGFQGSPYAENLTVQMYAVVNKGDGVDYRGPEGRGDRSPDSSGEVHLTGLAPGLYSARLMLSNSRRGWGGQRALDTRDIEIQSGENAIDLSVPALHDLAIYVPDGQEGRTVWAVPIQEEGSNPGFWGYNQATLGADLRARIEGLPAGRYTVSAQGQNRSQTVDVPGGEVVIESRTNNALQVTLSTQEGSLYRAGLRVGDHIVGLNGRRYEDAEKLQVDLRGSGSVSVLVLRNGELIDVSVDRAESPLYGNRSSLGGQLRQVMLDE